MRFRPSAYGRQKFTFLSIDISVASLIDSKPMMSVLHPASRNRSSSSSSSATLNVVSHEKSGTLPSFRIGTRAFKRSFVYETRERKLSSTMYIDFDSFLIGPGSGNAVISLTMFSMGLKRKELPLMSGTLQKRH